MQVNVEDPVNHPFAGEYSLTGFPTIRIFKRMYDSDPNNPLGTMDRWDVEDRTKETVRILVVTFVRRDVISGERNKKKVSVSSIVQVTI